MLRDDCQVAARNQGPDQDYGWQLQVRHTGPWLEDEVDHALPDMENTNSTLKSPGKTLK